MRDTHVGLPRLSKQAGGERGATPFLCNGDFFARDLLRSRAGCDMDRCNFKRLEYRVKLDAGNGANRYRHIWALCSDVDFNYSFVCNWQPTIPQWVFSL